MIQRSDVCVLIPAYNEEKNIVRVVSGVTERGYDVVVVDDGSTDSTAEKVRALGIQAVYSQVNQGKGAAVQAGFDWFLKQRYSALVVMDSDGQHRPEEIDVFISALNASGADLVIGNRMANPTGMSLLRVCTNRFMSWVISSAAGQPIPDTQCGYRALTRKAVQSIRLCTQRFEAESEMILRASRAGLRIVPVTVTSVYDDEVSRIRPARDTVRFFTFLFKFLTSKS